MPNKPQLFQYPKCSTCRKAAQWLNAAGIDHESTDLVTKPPAASKLADLHARSGLPIAKLFNVSGESYRAGNWKARLPELSETQAYAALAADGKLIKRPILDTGSTVLVGFDEAAWSTAMGKRKR